MADAFIYDHVRTPRGRGKADGSLHAHHADPARGAGARRRARPQRARHRAASTTSCSAACRRSASRAPTSRASPCWSRATTRSVPGQQLNRFCASGLEAVNSAAAQVMSGQSDGVDRRRRRVDVARADGHRRRRLGHRSGGRVQHVLRAAGRRRRPDRDARRLHPRDVDALRGREPAPRGRGLGRRPVRDRSVVPVRDVLGEVALDRDEHLRPEHDGGGASRS